MYVTRRFLRSTMMPDASVAHETTTTTAAAPPENARRRASPSSKRTSDAMPVEKVTSGSDGPSRGSSKKKASPRPSHAITSVADLVADAGETREKLALQYVGYGMLVDARDSLERWCEAKIIDLDAAEETVFVHYVGWNSRYDAWLSVEFLAAHGSHTGAEKKSAGGGSSWNGKTSLFAPAADAMENNFDHMHPQQQQEDPEIATSAPNKEKKQKKAKKAKKVKKKKREGGAESSSKKRRSRSGDSQQHDIEEGVEEIHLADNAAQSDEPELPTPRKRARRATMKAKAEPNGQEAPPKPKKQLKVAKVHPVRVAVATTDEASERKSRRSRKANVDMELDMDVRDLNVSEASASVADEEREGLDVDDVEAGKRSSKKAGAKKGKAKMKRGGAADVSAHMVDNDSSATAEIKTGRRQSKSAGKAGDETVAGIAPTAAPKRGGRTRQNSNQQRYQPPRAPVVLSETREKLASIFRLRLQQRQQLEQLMECDPSAEATSLQEETRQAEVVPNGSRKKQAATATAVSSAAASFAEASAHEAYIHYHHAQQIQQYYYQQALMASNANLMDPSGEAALQGGIIDSRIIHAGVESLELQRQMREQQFQDYFQHLAVTRERNMAALASNQEFLAKSGQAWQHQQSGDETTGDGENPQAPGSDARVADVKPETTLVTDSSDGATASGREMDGSSSAEPTAAKVDGADSASTVKCEDDESAGGAAGAVTTARNEGEKGSVLYEFVL